MLLDRKVKIIFYERNTNQIGGQYLAVEADLTIEAIIKSGRMADPAIMLQVFQELEQILKGDK